MGRGPDPNEAPQQMRRITAVAIPRPGLRAGVLAASAILVVVAALLVANNVSDHLAAAAIDEATITTQAVIHADVDPVIDRAMGVNASAQDQQALDEALGRLVASGDLLRIKIWGPDGTIRFSDLPALRGLQFPLDDDLSEALAGEPSHDLSKGEDPENIFERGLASDLLSVYLPIRGADGTVVGAYEVYQDAAPMLRQIAQTRQDVLLIVGVMTALLLAGLYAAFSGASSLLTRQNRKLRQQAATEHLLTTDLRRSEERFRSLVQNSADVYKVLRADGTIAYEAPAVTRVLGYRPEDRVGRSMLDLVHPDDRAWVDQTFADVHAVAGAQRPCEYRARHADGSWRWIESTWKNLLDEPAVGGVVVNYRDVTVRKALEDDLKHQAFHDSLTGLANRALFADRLEHALARVRRGRASVAVLFIDLDDFKGVNDSLGHGQGDLLLIGVAERLRTVIRAGDTLARMGGDEYAVLLDDAEDPTIAADLAARFLDVLGTAFDIGGRELVIHASIGVAVAASRDQTADELLRNADVAMYVAKQNGKARIEQFEPAMHAAAVTHLALRADLELATARGEFALLYQPVIDLTTGHMTGVEALIRWHHPERGVVNPNDFIPIAEETGAIVGIGRWVLDEACRQAAAWLTLAPDRPLTMNLNVSGRQLVEPEFVAEVSQALRASGIEPRRLVLEFTEGVLLADTASIATTIERLHQLGVRLAIDDFGTGYSSLAYLQRWPIDILKIDRSFVAAMADGPGEATVIGSILELSRGLNLETVAEGVETADQLARLRAIGARQGQGFFFARPLRPSAIAELLASGPADMRRTSGSASQLDVA